MLNIQKAIERLERKVEQLQQNVNKGKGAVAVLVFSDHGNRYRLSKFLSEKFLTEVSKLTY